MKTNAILLSILAASLAACQKNDESSAADSSPDIADDSAALQAAKQEPIADPDPLPTKFSEVKDDIVTHRSWRIGDDDSGVFHQTANENAREPLPAVRLAAKEGVPAQERGRGPNRDRSVPRGMIHRYNFTVEKTGYVVMLVSAHASIDGAQSAAPQMALFRDDGTLDKQHIDLPIQTEVPDQKDPHEFPTGQYAVDGGHGFVVQDLAPGDYIVLVKPRDRNAFGGIQRLAIDLSPAQIKTLENADALDRAGLETFLTDLLAPEDPSDPALEKGLDEPILRSMVTRLREQLSENPAATFQNMSDCQFCK